MENLSYGSGILKLRGCGDALTPSFGSPYGNITRYLGEMRSEAGRRWNSLSGFGRECLGFSAAWILYFLSSAVGKCRAPLD
jgi:hypothetical protein